MQAETGLEEGHNTEAEMKRHIETVLFGSRWVLVVFYVGLIVAMCVYALFFLKELAHMVLHQGGFTKESMLMSVLELVDITMIGNLVKMIITGSYTSFVTKMPARHGEHVSSGALKVKMATSLIGVSSIQLLQTFISSAGHSMDSVVKQLVIHVAFLVGALVLAVIDRLHERTDLERDAFEVKHKASNELRPH